MLGTKHNFFQNSYFPSSIKEWNRLDIDIRKSDSISIFKKGILSFIRPLPNKVSNSHNPQGLTLLIRFQLGLSHLLYHKFKFEGSLFYKRYKMKIVALRKINFFARHIHKIRQYYREQLYLDEVFIEK